MKILVDSCRILLAGIASSSTVGPVTLAIFVAASAVGLFVQSGHSESNNLIAVQWVSVEGILDKVCSDVTSVSTACSIQLAAPEIFESV